MKIKKAENWPGGRDEPATEAMRPGIGRAARQPGDIPWRGWWLIARRTVLNFFGDQVMLISAGVTLYLLIALVPALSTIVSIYGLFSETESISEQLSLLSGIVPAGGLDILRTELTRIAGESDQTLGWALILALAVAFWSASLGVNGLFVAMNVAYGEDEKRNVFLRTAGVLLFTVVSSVVVVVAIAAVVIMPAVLAIVPILGDADWVVRIASFLILGGLLLVWLGALYRWGPSREGARWRWITPGAAFAIVVILLVSVLFSWYVASFANFSASYGSLGALIGFLVWLWFSTIAVVMGAELNAEIERQTAIDSTTPPDLPIGERGAYVADTLGS
jgi:membrane protein